MSDVVTVESDFSLRKMRIAGICLLGQLFCTSMLIIGPMSMLMLPMTEGFGWSRSQFSFSTAAVMWAGALAAPVLGRLIDRRGVRPVVLTGAFSVGLLELALGFQTASLWLFYLLFALLGIVGAIGAGYGKVMGSLFIKHRGKAMGFVAAFSPLIASVFPQYSNQILLSFGWRGVFWGWGAVTLVTWIFLYFFLEEPNSSPNAAMPANSAQPVLEGMTTAEALRSRPLWIMIAAALVSGILGGGWATHSFAYQLSRGFSQQTAVNAVSVSVLIAIVGPLLGGWLLDKVPTARIRIPFSLMAALSVYLQSIMWANYGGIPLLFTAVALSAVSMNATMPMLGYFYTRFFGLRAYGEIAGINMAVLSLVMGFSAPLVGMIYDRTGSYSPALYGMIVGSVLAGLLYLFIGRYRYTTDFKLMVERGKVEPDKITT